MNALKNDLVVNPSSPAVSKRMSKQRSRNTGPELLLRRALHRMGLRYRVHYRVPGSRGSIDVVFIGARVAVFVDGCFWHRCPLHGSLPRANRDWWLAKLDRNVERDRLTNELLTQLGWQVLRFWEHDSVLDAAGQGEMAVRAANRT